MALYTTYDAVGFKEDVSDLITTITPTKVPFQSAIGSESMDNTLAQWQEDTLRAAAANSFAQGFTAAASARAATSMLGNRSQILSDTFEISRTNERVKKYGRKSEVAYQTMKAGAQLKRDLETIILGGSGAQTAAAGSEGVAPLMGNYNGSIANVSGGGTLVTVSANTTTAVAGALTEASVLSVMQKLYNEGGEVTTLSVKASDASIIAGFAAIANTRIRDYGSGTKIVNVVDFYKSPWGEVKVIINRFQATANALYYDPENWTLLYIDKWFKEKLAKVGDKESYMLVGEYSLKHKSRASSGINTTLA